MVNYKKMYVSNINSEIIEENGKLITVLIPSPILKRS